MIWAVLIVGGAPFSLPWRWTLAIPLLFTGQNGSKRLYHMWDMSTVASIGYVQAFANCTAWKWQLEKKNHDLVPELVAYALTQSFNHTSHHCGHDSSPPIAVYTYSHGQAAIVRPLRTHAWKISAHDHDCTLGDWKWRIVATMVARMAETSR